MPSDVRWQVRKAQCKTCMEEVPNGRGADGRLVWVVYRDGGEFGCRPNAVEAIAYATRKARAYVQDSRFSADEARSFAECVLAAVVLSEGETR